MNQLAAMIREEHQPREEKKKLSPLRGERAAVCSLHRGEFGLLDILFLDAIITNDAECK